MSKVATLLPKPSLYVLPAARSFPARKKANRAPNNTFLQALVREVRRQDRSGFYRSNSNREILQSFLAPSTARLHISAFYHAVAAEIERITGRKTQLFLNLNQTDLGSVLIFCDRLLVLSDLLRNVSGFKFDAIDQLSDRGATEIQIALIQANRYF